MQHKTLPSLKFFNCSCELGVGDLQSEEEKDIVLELKLPALSSPQQDLVLKASLSYFNVITSTINPVSCDLTVDRKGIFTRFKNIENVML